MGVNARRPERRNLVADTRAAEDACAVANMRLAARRLTQFLADRMKAAELGVAQFGRMVLEREGLVEMADDQSDSRRRAVRLTEEGARRLEQAFIQWRKAHDEIATLIDVEAVKRLAKATEPLSES